MSGKNKKQRLIFKVVMVHDAIFKKKTRVMGECPED